MGSSLINLFPAKEPEEDFLITWSSQQNNIFDGWINNLIPYIFISLIFHLGLILSFSGISFLTFYSSGMSSKYLSESSGLIEENLVAFDQALHETLKDKNNQKNLQFILEKLKTAKIPNITSDFIFLDPNMSQKERVEFFRQIIEKTFLDQSYFQENIPNSPNTDEVLYQPHNYLRISTGDKIFLERSLLGENKYEVYILKKNISRVLEEMKKAGLIQEKLGYIAKEPVLLYKGTEQIEIPAEYFYRSCDYQKIISKGASLFFITKGFSRIKGLEGAIEPTPGPDVAENRMEGKNLSESETFKIIYYGEIQPAEMTSGENFLQVAKKFNFPREKWSELLNSLMVYHEVEQFRQLEAKFLQEYDPNDPTLADFFREFINSNINGAIFLYHPLQVAFDSLEELYNKSPIFERLLFYLDKAPSSLLAAEFLFCLASALDFERRTIEYLDKAYPTASDFLKRKVNSGYLFNSLAKALTIKAVYEELRKYLASAGFNSPDDILSEYNKEILKIYRFLSEKGGDIGDRARFALGCFLWETGNKEESIKVWKKISLTFKTQPFPRIRGILYNPKFKLIEENVNMILDYEARCYTNYLNQRAVKFHKWSRGASSQQLYKTADVP